MAARVTSDGTPMRGGGEGGSEALPHAATGVEVGLHIHPPALPFLGAARTWPATTTPARGDAASSDAGVGGESAGGAGSGPSWALTPTTAVTGKRRDYLPWDDYFMAVAFLSSRRSKDPSTQVGACIVDGENRIVGIGYNGFPRGCDDDALPWTREGDTPLETKYPYVVHAEMNAILNKNTATLKGCRIYVALFPCNECTKMILQCGIVEVVYLSDKYHDTVPMVASRRMLDLAGVTYRRHVPRDATITLSFTDFL